MTTVSITEKSLQPVVDDTSTTVKEKPVEVKTEEVKTEEVKTEETKNNESLVDIKLASAPPENVSLISRLSIKSISTSDIPEHSTEGKDMFPHLIIFSDIHLGGSGSVKYLGDSSKLLKYFQYLLDASPKNHLILVGDILDPMGSACCSSLEDRTNQIKNEIDCANQIVLWAKYNSRVHMVYGNHDFLGDNDITVKLLGAQREINISLGKHNIHIEHGNVLDRSSWWCMPCCCTWINKCFDKWRACCCCLEDSKETQLDYSKRYIQEHPETDVVIMGHIHHQDIKMWTNEGKSCLLINPGCATDIDNQIGQIDLTLNTVTDQLSADASTVHLEDNSIRVVPNPNLSIVI